jgi:hypothetical protein
VAGRLSGVAPIPSRSQVKRAGASHHGVLRAPGPAKLREMPYQLIMEQRPSGFLATCRCSWQAARPEIAREKAVELYRLHRLVVHQVP